MPRIPSKSKPTPNPEIGYPTSRVTASLRQLKHQLTGTAGRPLGTQALGQLTGRAARTIEHWLEGETMEQARFLFSLLERLPPRQRHEWLDAACRLQPTLQHPRLAHDPLVRRQLERLLGQPQGLAVIHGGSPFQRAFLLMALGNTAWLEGGRTVVGFDRHGLDWATPPQVKCLPLPLDFTFPKIWADFAPAPGSLLLLGNSGLDPSSTLLPHWAARCLVLMTEVDPAGTSKVPAPPLIPSHRLAVTAAREQPEWLRVQISAG